MKVILGSRYSPVEGLKGIEHDFSILHVYEARNSKGVILPLAEVRTYARDMVDLDKDVKLIVIEHADYTDYWTFRVIYPKGKVPLQDD